jgi:hypothetical protein
MSEVSTVVEADDELETMRGCAKVLDQLDDGARRRVLRWLVDRYVPDLYSTPLGSPSSQFAKINTDDSQVIGSAVTVKRFMQEKAPQTDVERITALAYYLTHYRGVPHFKTADLSALNIEAAQPKFSNAANAASNAQKSSGFLADAGKGLRQITSKGEEAVEALPDREALKLVASKYAARRRRTSAKGARAQSGE